ncbi:Kinesin-like protein K39 [Diplonema papillatum]|nr:Kinesin-like protein K39 [Diplonema papillatum]
MMPLRPRRSLLEPTGSGHLSSPLAQSRRGSSGSKQGSPRRRSNLNGTSIGAPSGESSSVKVIVRVRPFVRREIDIHEEQVASGEVGEHLRSIIQMPQGLPGVVTVLDHERAFSEKERFQFDHAIWSILPDQQEYSGIVAGQPDVFQEIGAPILENAWAGYNNCIFAYGQTGSGKTHTMMGADAGRDPGIIPRICSGLFDGIKDSVRKIKAAKDASAHMAPALLTKEHLFEQKFKVEVRFMEIYNEHVKDLLWHLRTQDDIEELRQDNHGQYPDPTNLQVRKHPVTGPYVTFLTAKECSSAEECLDLINQGNLERATASTKMNERSSRSHAIFKITFTQTTKSPAKTKFDKPTINERVAHINLIDLAGSERVKKSQSTGQQLVEASSINLSLTTLKMVIDALVEQSKARLKKINVPYRDSTLTWLLSDSLGGNSKTMMCCNVSPHPDNAEETISTLRYGSKAREIVNFVTVNEDDEAKRIQDLELEMLALQNQLEEATPDSASSVSLRKQLDQSKVEMDSVKKQMIEKAARAEELEEELERTEDIRLRSSFQHAFQLTVAKRANLALAKEKEELKNLLESQREMTMTDMSSLNHEKEANRRHAEKIQNLQRKIDDLSAEQEKAESAKEALQDDLNAMENALQHERLMSTVRVREWEEEKDSLSLTVKESTDAMVGDLMDQVTKSKESEERVKAKVESLYADIRKLEKENKRLKEDLHLVADTADEKELAMQRVIRELREKNRDLASSLNREAAKAGDEWRTRFTEKESEMFREIGRVNAKWEKELQRKDRQAKDAMEALRENQKLNVLETRKLLEMEQRRTRDTWQAKWDAATQEWKARYETKSALCDEMQNFLKDVEVREARYSSLAERVMDAMTDSHPSGSPDYVELVHTLQRFSKEYTSFAPSRRVLQDLISRNNHIHADPTPLVGLDDDTPAFYPLTDSPRTVSLSPTYTKSVFASASNNVASFNFGSSKVNVNGHSPIGRRRPNSPHSIRPSSPARPRSPLITRRRV